MNAPFIHFRFIMLITVVTVIIFSCKKKNDPQPATGLRTPIDYAVLKPTTPYKTFFVDALGDSTVDRNDGRNILRMLQAMDAYCQSAGINKVAIDSTVLSNMFRNKSNSFKSPFSDLNALNYSIQKYTATSTTFKSNTDLDFEKMFGAIAKASLYAATTGSYGNAGVYGSSYLADTAGVEYAQVIARSFIGAVQLDYISNVLLFEGIKASNLILVPGKKYTPLEHNWDIAYGLFTSNDVYALGATDDVLNPGETFLGAIVWQYNKGGYKKIYPAFLKGRAAIVNNDLNELRTQALIIRNNLEMAIGASTAAGMDRAAQLATMPEKIHAFSAGYGSIYATRFCTLYGGNVSFSNGLKQELFTSTITRFQDINPDQLYIVYNNVNVKFNLY